MMQKYRKAGSGTVNVIGMLHIVEVRLVSKDSEEKIKHKLLMVGCEAADIERKLRWVFDASKYQSFSVTSVEKVREKIHTLSTVITQEKAETEATIKRIENTQQIAGVPSMTEQYNPNLYAVGITTTILAADEEHALRKVGRALMERTSEVKSGTAPMLSADSTIQVEEIPKSSGFVRPRDVSGELNKAHFVRG
jgi:hypothetical protein